MGIGRQAGQVGKFSSGELGIGDGGNRAIHTHKVCQLGEVVERWGDVIALGDASEKCSGENLAAVVETTVKTWV